LRGGVALGDEAGGKVAVDARFKLVDLGKQWPWSCIVGLLLHVERG
jgi:hypothetical protein